MDMYAYIHIILISLFCLSTKHSWLACITTDPGKKSIVLVFLELLFPLKFGLYPSPGVQVRSVLWSLLPGW